MTLHFSSSNRKLNHLAQTLGIPKNQVVAFDLPAGYTCPCASECKSQFNIETHKIQDGKDMKFRCYAATLEGAFPSVRNAHWDNYNAIVNLSSNEIADLILSELSDKVKVVRIHASGDFFHVKYFDAWVKVAFMRPNTKFFAYSKMLNFVKANKPSNFKIQYSFGGLMDKNLTDQPTAYVFKSAEQAIAKGVAIACQGDDEADDFFRIMNGESFALLVHGQQPAKAKA